MHCFEVIFYLFICVCRYVCECHSTCGGQKTMNRSLFSHLSYGSGFQLRALSLLASTFTHWIILWDSHMHFLNSFLTYDIFNYNELLEHNTNRNPGASVPEFYSLPSAVDGWYDLCILVFCLHLCLGEGVRYWSYKQLWAVTCMQGIEPGSSVNSIQSS